MKNFKFLSMLLAAASLLLASCSIDNLSSSEINDGEECLVSFAIQIPGELGTKSRIPMDPPEEFPDEEEPELNLDPEPEPTPEEPGPLPVDPEDPDTPTVPVVDPFVPGGGTMVKKLSYFVYKVTDYRNEFEATCAPTETYGTIDLTDLTASIDLTLMKGIRYRIVFWADAFGRSSSSPYNFDMDTGKLYIDFDKIYSNQENLDAFYNVIDIEKPSTGMMHNITLYRPFAQLNIGTELTKVKDVDVNAIKTGIKVPCANAISLIETWDQVSNDDIDYHTFNIASRPTDFIFPVEPSKYAYFCMNYILVPYHEFEEESVVPVEFFYEIEGSKVSRTVNVPLEINHRTNIYGDLLTASSRINVSINPMFNDYYGDHNNELEPEISPLHDAGKTGGIFTLTEDLQLTQPVVVLSGKELTVDLNRYTISKDTSETGENCIFEVESGAYLNIEGFGQVKATGANSTNITIKNNGRLYIYGGSYDGEIRANGYTRLFGGGFKNHHNTVSSELAGYDLELKQIGDWSFITKEGFDTSSANGGWGVDWETLSSLMGHQSDFDQPTYVYSNSGVTYLISWFTQHAYASLSGDAIVLGLGGVEHGFTAHDGIREIGNYAFYECDDLGSSGGTVELPNTLESIGKYAFAGCTSLRSLVIPASVTRIGEAAFRGCMELRNINVPDGVTRIENETFSGAFNITSLELPNSVTFIGKKAFWNCWGLVSINIPNGVKEIKEEAFASASSLTSIELPNSVTSIGENAFNGCSSLQSVTMSNNVTEIGKAAFRSCRNLKNINISNKVKRIEPETFIGAGLSTIDFPESVKYFGSECFAGSYLTKIIIRAESFEFEDDSIFWGKNFTESDYNFITLYVHPNMEDYVRNMFSGLAQNYVWVNTLDELEE